MDTDEVKSLKRQRSVLRVVVVILLFATLASMAYAYAQHGIAQKNALLAEENAKEALRQAKATQKSVAESHRRVNIAIQKSTLKK